MNGEQETGSSYSIRALELGEVFDDAIALVKDNFALVLKMLCVAVFPVGVAYSLLMQRFFPEFVNLDTSLSPMMNPEILFGDIMLLNLLSMVYGLLYGGVALPLTGAALTHALAMRYLGRPAGLGASFKYVLRRAHWFLLLILVRFIAYMTGFFLCVIPGVLVTLYLFLAVPVFVLEDASVADSISRSVNLARNNLLKIFFLFFVFASIELFTGAAYFMGVPYVSLLINQVGGGFLAAIWYAVAMVFYFSTRCEKENLDLDLMAEAVDTPAAAPETAL